LCHTWLNESKIIAGTEDSRIFVFEEFETKAEIPVGVGANSSARSIHCILPFTKGLIVGASSGSLLIFERNDENKDGFKKVKEFILGDESGKIMNLTLSPNEENLLVSLSNNQIYFINFGSIEMVKVSLFKFEPK
jgi:hypothetical protein